MSDFARRPLLVVALGGNALSPPRPGVGLARQRQRIRQTGAQLRQLADAGFRLLIVHGNGPQVGRLLGALAHDAGQLDLDVHVAQTQGELGYLLCAAMRPVSVVALVTRVEVALPPGPPVKPVGPLLSTAPAHVASSPVAGGWRRTVPSPRPVRILEQALIARLVQEQHLIAGGGGGVPLDSAGEPVDCVVDKDWIASALAIRLAAHALWFVTDVPGVLEPFGSPEARVIQQLDTRTLADRLDAYPEGSMRPKLEAAMAFVDATGRSARICGLEGFGEPSAAGPAPGESGSATPEPQLETLAGTLTGTLAGTLAGTLTGTRIVPATP